MQYKIIVRDMGVNPCLAPYTCQWINKINDCRYVCVLALCAAKGTSSEHARGWTLVSKHCFPERQQGPLQGRWARERRGRSGWPNLALLCQDCFGSSKTLSVFFLSVSLKTEAALHRHLGLRRINTLATLQSPSKSLSPCVLV